MREGVSGTCCFWAVERDDAVSIDGVSNADEGIVEVRGDVLVCKVLLDGRLNDRIFHTQFSDWSGLYPVEAD